jgi:hypothetical protein
MVLLSFSRRVQPMKAIVELGDEARTFEAEPDRRGEIRWAHGKPT